MNEMWVDFTGGVPVIADSEVKSISLIVHWIVTSDYNQAVNHEYHVDV